MTMVQLKCPETGRAIDIGDVEPRVAHMPMTADLRMSTVACPHCGEHHRWGSPHWGNAMIALRDRPDATRVLVEGTPEGISATALP